MTSPRIALAAALACAACAPRLQLPMTRDQLQGYGSLPAPAPGT